MRIHLPWLGDFAGAVAGAAASRLHGHRVTARNLAVRPHAAPAFWPTADLRVLVTGRSSHHLERQLDRAVQESRVPAAVVTLEHPRLRLGPLVGTGGACLSCLRVRQAQHDSGRTRLEALTDAYDRDAVLEPRGYLPHHVGLAVEWITEVVRALETGRDAPHAGLVRTVNLHTGVLGADRVIGVHGCPRCRRTPPLQESSWRGLAADLQTVGGGRRA